VVRVEVRRFQSLAHSVIEVDGFSALVGPSNIGKSAIVRAVKAALTGAPADAFIRHDADCPRATKGAKSCKCFCSVQITAPGFDLLWEKGDSVNRYVYNGIEYTAVSRGTPEFLIKDFAPAKIGDEKEIIQVSEQFKPIFILDKSGTVVADVLSDVVKLDQINTAIRLSEKDRKEASATRKVRERDIVDLKLALSDYDGLDDALSLVTQAEEADHKAQETQQQLEQLEQFIDTAYGLARKIKVLNQSVAIEPPSCEQLVSVWETFCLLARLDAVRVERESLVEQLSGVDVMPVPSLDAFGVSGTNFTSLSIWVAKLDSMRTFFVESRSLAGLPLPTMDAAKEACAVAIKLVGWGERLDNLTQTIKRLEESKTKADQDEVFVTSEFQALGVCPTCSQNLSASHEHV
jgi:hypothetical protein